MMSKKMMIDVRVYSESGKMSFERYEIDDFEFCVRDGRVYFIAGGKRMNFPLEDVSQVYMV